MEGLALVLFYLTLIGTIASIGLLVYSSIKKDFKYRPKKLVIVLGIFIAAFIGSTVFYGSVQSPESKAKYITNEKAKADEKAQKELLEQQNKSEGEKLKEEEHANKEVEATIEKPKKEVQVEKEIPIGDNRFILTTEPNKTAAVDELTLRAKQYAPNATDAEIKEAVKFTNDNYNNYWTDNSIMEKAMYYGSLLEYSNKNNDIKSLGADTVQVVKYIYRKVEKVEDASTQSNLKQIKKSLDKIPDEYKK